MSYVIKHFGVVYEDATHTLSYSSSARVLAVHRSTAFCWQEYCSLDDYLNIYL